MNQFSINNLFKTIIVIVLVAVSFSIGLFAGNGNNPENPAGCEDIALDLEKKYQDISAIEIDKNASDYEKLIANADKQCPFISTAFTSDCLDRLILKREAELKNLIAETTKQARAKKEEIDKIFGSFSEIDLLLSELPKYDELWKDYSESFCTIVNANIGGSGIVEASRKCRLFQIEQYMQLLKDQEDWIK